jgi:hypothetical protein
MGQRERDRAAVSSLHTIAARTWEPPTGQERDTALARIRDIADDRADLLAEAASIMLGLRPSDENELPQYSAGAALLLGGGRRRRERRGRTEGVAAIWPHPAAKASATTRNVARCIPR